MPSEYAKNANGYLGTTHLGKVFQDYNAHTYWITAPLQLMLPKELKIPKWFHIALGYSANGMYGEFENITSYRGIKIPATPRYRQLLLSLDIDWSQIPTSSKTLQWVFKGLNFVKLPLPAVEYNSLGAWNAYWLY